MKKVGLYYHPSFNSQGHLTYRERLRDLPEALHDLLQHPNIRLYENPRAELDWILQVHDRDMVARVDLEDDCRTAYESVGGVVAAMTALARGELDRACCAVGAGGHMAGYREFWGGSCFNDVVIALKHVRQISPCRRFAIVDTDAYHAAGTLQLLDEDADVLHLCFCRSNYHSLDGLAIEVDVYRQERPGNSHDRYLGLVRRNLPYVTRFAPDLLVWYFGYNTHRDESASLGLTEETFVGICDLLDGVATQLKIPLLVVLGGGHRRQVAAAVIPGIIRRLTEDSEQ